LLSKLSIIRQNRKREQSDSGYDGFHIKRYISPENPDFSAAPYPCFFGYLCQKTAVKKHQQTFELTEDYIELIKLLKLLGIAESGGEARQLVEDGAVRLNNTVENRKRAKLRSGDVITIANIEILIK
jgi:ribosome-associated protein